MTMSASLSPRAARRVFVTVACLCACPGADDVRHRAGLRALGARLGLDEPTMDALEDHARRRGELHVGEAPEERWVLRASVEWLARVAPLRGPAAETARRLGVLLAARPCPFEDSGPGLPLVRALAG